MGVFGTSWSICRADWRFARAWRARKALRRRFGGHAGAFQDACGSRPECPEGRPSSNLRGSHISGVSRMASPARSLLTRWAAVSKPAANPRFAFWGRLRGRSSDGRALQSHCRGQGFDSPRLHHPSSAPLDLLRFIPSTPKPTGEVWESGAAVQGEVGAFGPRLRYRTT